jgi:thioredoxin reductase
MPSHIAEVGKKQVMKYDSVDFIHGTAVKGKKEGTLFVIEVETGITYTGRKLLFASGIKDMLPDIQGLSDCWGISILHCPYCHGYEVSNTKIGLLGNGDTGFELAKLISNWSRELILLTNGVSALTAEQRKKLQDHGIVINEKEISHVNQHDGYLEQIVFGDGTTESLRTIFARVPFEQHCKIPEALGCELTAQGFLKIDDFQRTTVNGIYAAGDNTTFLRAVAAAVAAGNKAGGTINKELIEEAF